MPLADQQCVPCRGGVPPITGEAIDPLLKQLNGWEVIADHHLSKHYKFPDFKTALDFVNRVGAIAEQQGHHPGLVLEWGKVEITVYTHKIGGLSEGDFILAAKIDQLQN